MIEADLLTGFSNIYNVYADNQQIMQKWCKLIAETPKAKTKCRKM